MSNLTLPKPLHFLFHHQAQSRMSEYPASLLGESGEAAGYIPMQLDQRGATFLEACGIPYTGIRYCPDRDTSDKTTAAAAAASGQPVPKTRAFVERANVQ